MEQRSSKRRSFAGKRATAPSGDPLDRAVGLLARRAHSQWELRRKLRLKGFGAEAVDTAMARLVELGYLDDSAFAKGLVQRRGSLRGPRALSAELASKGVDRAEADAAVAGFDTEAQLVSATRLAERLYARKAGTGYREMLDTIGTKLLRRGFSAPVVREACRSVLAGTAQPPED